MEKLISLDLYCPFSSQINKNIDFLEEYSLEWVLGFNLLANESSYQRFCKSNFFLMAATTYPYCNFQELKIANDWLSWLFIWDDQCDLSELKTKPESLKAIHKRFLEILNGAEVTSYDIPLSRALSNLRERMLEKASLKWLNYFICGFEKYLHGCFEEANNRVDGIVPDTDTYIAMRRLSAGADVALPLIELCDQLIIPDFLRKQDIFKQLNEITNNLLGWSNDIFSLSRELATGHVHNLVFVLHYQHKISLEEAMKLAMRMHDNEIQKLVDLEANIPSFGKEIDPELAKYILGIHAWIRGNLDWYSFTARYKTVEMLELA
ncbi:MULTISPECIES: terpene synthase family protein [unclassified Nostoc]|uniref:terpene synthase family protein n=1 Tax=unclassified Nostoc TaxID=2593658 RepID=UPI002AD23215|nr:MULTISPECIES: terpene synthase [unclassified Nostoc]MDZ8122311.1 terpene synthase [Nostoc sp. CmiVER01]MDZ8225435.1 terpene synthase [Nostoc sp. ChiVER01]